MTTRVLIAFLGLVAVCSADVVRPAPNFSWDGPPNANSARAVKGQPIVLLITKSAHVGAFRAQVKKLKELYQSFASRKVVFAAAIVDGTDDIRSDIPFVLVRNGAEVAANYDVNEKFNIVIIGKDGNVDYQTDRVIPGARVQDVIANSFVEQADRRK